MAERREGRAGGGQRDARAALERYQLHGIRETGKELGRGSYAAVIEVHYKGMLCAAKKIYDILLGEGDRSVERFEEECRLLRTLRHPHIVQFLGIYFHPTTDLPVLVMEFLPATLAQCVDRYGRLPAEICYAILRDVALGLRYLHERRPRLIHRDLSANNVLLTGDMAAKISDLGVAKILQINPTDMSRMTQTPGTHSYMPPEALCPNPQYDIEVDVFSFGVMMVHVLSGQWPFPSEATRVDPRNPAAVIGLSEVERRAQYLNVIGCPSDEEEGHPLMALIVRCLSNSPNLRPNASELVERMSDISAQQPLTFSNRVDMMHRIDSIQREKETLQTQVSKLGGQVEQVQAALKELREQSQRQEAALAVEVEQLKLQVGSLEAEKTHISTTAAAREDLLHTELQKKEESFQASIESMDRQLQIELQKIQEMYQESLAIKERQLQTQQREHQEKMKINERQHEVKLQENERHLQVQQQEYQERLEAKERQHEIQIRDHQERLNAKERQHELEIREYQERLEAKERQAEVKRKDDQLQANAIELSSQNSLLSQQRSTIEALHTQLTQTRENLASGTQVHVFSPNSSLVWRECASLPVRMWAAKTTVINGMVYVGGNLIDNDGHENLVCKYDPVKDQWNTLPPSPVKRFGIGQVNGKLVVVGGRGGEGVTGDIHVFEEDTQQWVRSIPPMPRGLVAATVVSHSSSLVVCGTPDETSSSVVLVYSSQSSQWHLAAALPLTFDSTYSSAVVLNDTYYVAAGSECFIDKKNSSSSPAVFSLPLSTLLDPNAPQGPSIWQRMPDTQGYMSHLAVTGGCLLALGGFMPSNNILTNIWQALSKTSKATNFEFTTAVHAFCPATSSCSWVKIGDLPDIRYGPAITTLSSGELFIAGGLLHDKKVIRGIIKINS